MVVVVKSMSSTTNATASHLYMKYKNASLRKLELCRDKMFVKMRGRDGGEKGEKEEKEIENHISNIQQTNEKNEPKEEENVILSLDVNKVIDTLCVHLEKTQSDERKKKLVDKKNGKIVYNTKDGRVLHAFHSCERGKILWDDNVYDDLKSWLAAASIVAPSRGD
jgi:hypothetical protein